MNLRTHPRAVTGFTLMEVMIALVASAVVLAAIHAVFFGALHLRNRTVQAMDDSVGLQQTLGFLQRDLANLVVPGGTLSGTLQTTRTGSTQNDSAGGMASQLPLNQPGQSSPEFHTSTGLIDETSPWGEVQKVSYFLMSSTNGGSGKDLVRSVTRNLLPVLQEQPVLIPLLGGVQSLYFLYHDGTQWQETWDSTTQPTPLPCAIKVQITFAVELGQSPSSPVELVVPIFAQGRTNQTAQSTGGG